MESENKPFAHMQGDAGGQPPQGPPQYAPQYPQTMQQQPGPPYGYQQQQYPSCPPTTAGSPHYTAPSGAVYGGGYGALPSQQQTTVVVTNQPGQ